MATRDKRLEAMRRNPRNVRFETLRRVLEDHGFTGKRSPGRDHWRFSHRTVLTVDPRRPFLLVPYVIEALKAIDEADEAGDREAKDGEDRSP